MSCNISLNTHLGLEQNFRLSFVRKKHFYGLISPSNIFNYLTASEVFYAIHILLLNIMFYNIDRNTNVGLKLKLCTKFYP